MFRLVYDESVIGLCLEDANDLVRASGDRYRALVEEQPYFHEVVFFDVLTGEARWVRTRVPDSREEKVRPEGPAATFVLSRES